GARMRSSPPRRGPPLRNPYTTRVAEPHWPGSLDHANWILTRPEYSGKWHTVATLHIPLDREKPVALARQIQAHLERLIRDGHLGDGVKLPATRELAKGLGVNRATVAFAYDELVAAGHARAHVGQGTFVVSAAKPARPAPEVRVRTPINWTGLLSRSARIVAAEEDRWRRVSPGEVDATTVSFAG